jgi:hypothetical protein
MAIDISALSTLFIAELCLEKKKEERTAYGLGFRSYVGSGVGSDYSL